MLPTRAVAGALEERGQLREHRRRIALVVGGSPAASPISRRAIAKRVTESIISSTSRPWSRKYSAMAVATSAPRGAHERRLVAGRHDHHRARQSFRPEVALDEFAHLAAALADQRDHVDIGAVAWRASCPAARSCRRRSRRRCPSAARGRGEQTVDGANAGTERRLDAGTLQRVRRIGVEGIARGCVRSVRGRPSAGRGRRLPDRCSASPTPTSSVRPSGCTVAPG